MSMLVALKQQGKEVIQTHKCVSDFQVLLDVLHTKKKLLHNTMLTQQRQITVLAKNCEMASKASSDKYFNMSFLQNDQVATTNPRQECDSATTYAASGTVY